MKIYKPLLKNDTVKLSINTQAVKNWSLEEFTKAFSHALKDPKDVFKMIQKNGSYNKPTGKRIEAKPNTGLGKGNESKSGKEKNS